jgi:hypothetical protein
LVTRVTLIATSYYRKEIGLTGAAMEGCARPAIAEGSECFSENEWKEGHFSVTAVIFRVAKVNLAIYIRYLHQVTLTKNQRHFCVTLRTPSVIDFYRFLIILFDLVLTCSSRLPGRFEAARGRPPTSVIGLETFCPLLSFMGRLRPPYRILAFGRLRRGSWLG